MLRNAFLILVLIFILNGCCCVPPKPVVHSPVVKHIVFVWLKDPGNVSDRQKIIEVSRSFVQIPGVVDVSAGEVIISERKIVDDSFDVGITLSFVTEADMNAYLLHPKHKDAVKNVLMPLVKKIVVYDYKE